MSGGQSGFALLIVLWTVGFLALVGTWLVAAGRSRVDEMLHVPMPKGAIRVSVTAPIFYDKPGARLHV